MTRSLRSTGKVTTKRENEREILTTPNGPPDAQFKGTAFCCSPPLGNAGFRLLPAVWRSGGAEAQALPRVSFVQSGGQPLESFTSRSDYYANRKVGEAMDKPHFDKITLAYRYILPFCRMKYSDRIE